MKTSYRIAEISLGKPSLDSYYEYDYNGAHFEVQRFGSNFSIPYMKDMIISLHNKVDAFAFSDLPPIFRVRDKSFVHNSHLDIMSMPANIPLCNGGQLKEIATVNGVFNAIQEKKINPSKGIFFPLGCLYLEVIDSLEAHHKSIGFGDGFSFLRIPLVLKPGKSSGILAQSIFRFINLRDIKAQSPMTQTPLTTQLREILLQQMRKFEYIFCDLGPLFLFDSSLDFVRDKKIIITENNRFEDEIRDLGAKDILNIFPKQFQISPHINYAVLDATLRLSYKKTSPLSLQDWQKLLEVEMQVKNHTQRMIIGARPSYKSKIGSFIHKKLNNVREQKPPDFAFIVHPLSQDNLFFAKQLSFLKPLPRVLKNGLERASSHAPGIYYGEIKGIVSKKTNQPVNGVIYTLFSTPKMLLSEPPEVTYEKIESICHHAAEQGAKIIGLGAYTKVIGDSGETINRNSPIPVTTGNSLSASSTLWAVNEVAKKMGLLKFVPGTQIMDGTASVIGATGSIGSVSAKLLSLVFKRVCLVAPRKERLEALAEEIKKINPQCQIVISTDANSIARQTDVLVTATSAYDQKIIDVELLKPGCLVCDCSRPLDFTPEDAAKRPDVLIVESGEVILPGPVEITCNLGLPGTSVYACLAETALLAMEGRFEPFTLGRSIDWVKVKQIYKMAQDHGVKLAAIQGNSGFISDKEIALAREHALRRLESV